jgi:hypothetical protein
MPPGGSFVICIARARDGHEWHLTTTKYAHEHSGIRCSTQQTWFMGDANIYVLLRTRAEPPTTTPRRTHKTRNAMHVHTLVHAWSSAMGNASLGSAVSSSLNPGCRSGNRAGTDARPSRNSGAAR